MHQARWQGREPDGSRVQVRMGDPVSEVYVVTSHCGTMLARLMGSRMDRPLLVTTPDRIDTVTTAVAAHAAGVIPLAGIAITEHSGVPSPFRSALRAVFEGLERSDRHRAGDSQHYQLPIFITSMDTYHASQVCAAAPRTLLSVLQACRGSRNSRPLRSCLHPCHGGGTPSGRACATCMWLCERVCAMCMSLCARAMHVLRCTSAARGAHAARGHLQYLAGYAAALQHAASSVQHDASDIQHRARCCRRSPVSSRPCCRARSTRSRHRSARSRRTSTRRC
jgi:hypothetical protein